MERYATHIFAFSVSFYNTTAQRDAKYSPKRLGHTKLINTGPGSCGISGTTSSFCLRILIDSANIYDCESFSMGRISSPF